MNYFRGSMWRKWDLHIHSPLSALNNMYPKQKNGQPDWDQFVTKLELLTDVDVIGITDYCSIEGYDIVVQQQKEGRLRNIKLILPNVELRITPVTGKGHEINLHLIFSNKLAKHQIELFLRKISFRRGKETFYVDKQSLIDCGRSYKNDPTLAVDAAFKAGVEQFNIPFETIRDLINGDPLIKENVLVAISNSSNDGISGVRASSMDATRTELCKFANVLLSSNPNDIAYFLGKGDANETVVKNKYGRLKPCIHGSDAHELNRISVPCTKRSISGHDCFKNPDDCELRHTWIKANPTFEGFRQILFEPEDRVYVGSEVPFLKNKSKIIDFIEINNVSQWFSGDRIELNPDMVAIIGGKGAGKTALADIIAIAGGDFDSKSDESFIFKAREFVEGTGVKIGWADGVIDEYEINSKLEPYSQQKVKYLSLKYIEGLCAHSKEKDLLKVIEELVFQYIPDEDRLNFADFELLKNKRTEVIDGQIESIKREIVDITREIFRKNEDIVKTNTYRLPEIKKLEEEKKNLDKQRPKLANKEDEKVKSESDGLTVKMLKLKDEISALDAKLTCINEIKEKVLEFRKYIGAYNEEIKRRFVEIQEEEQISYFEFKEPSKELDSKVVKLILDAEQAIAERKKELKEYSDKKDGLMKKLSIAEGKRKELAEFDKKILDCQARIKSLGGEVAFTEKECKKKLEELEEKRIKNYVQYFEDLKNKRSKLTELYRPLEKNLKVEAGQCNVSFEARIVVDVNAYLEKCNDLVDGRSFSLDEEVLKKKVCDFAEQLNVINVASDAAISFLRGVKDYLEVGSALASGGVFRKKVGVVDFEDWLYSLDFFDVQYVVKYNDVELRKLSPGQRGIVLLYMFLALEKGDDRPLIIDQPEENLDNREIYLSLVGFFKSAKLKRQIIIVTHNPNLVVNTDSEQIIVANFDLAKSKQKSVIRYVSGALEDTFKNPKEDINILDQRGIREHVCDILEGGEVAFEKRESKYSIHFHS